MDKPYAKAVIGAYIGPKGAGKSLMLAMTIVRRLTEGQRVWSNMKVHTGPAILNRKYSPSGKKFEYRETEPLDWDLLFRLDKSFVEGTVAIDEMSYYASSRESMATRNKLINACVRQVRHRNLDVFYSARKLEWVDSYLRAETDFMVRCQDLSNGSWGQINDVPGGTVLRADFFDLSGQITGHSVYDSDGEWRPYKSKKYYGTPFWDCYDTREIMSIEEAFTGVSLQLKKHIIGNCDDGAGDEVKDKILREIQELRDSGTKNITIDAFWLLMREKHGLEGSPNILGHYVPREIKRSWRRNEGSFYNFDDMNKGDNE